MFTSYSTLLSTTIKGLNSKIMTTLKALLIKQFIGQRIKEPLAIRQCDNANMCLMIIALINSCIQLVDK